MALKNVFEWTDVLAHGSSMGHDWNTLHQILVDDGFPPMYECHTRDYGRNDFVSNGYGMSDTTCEVALSFMDSEGITEMTLTE